MGLADVVDQGAAAAEVAWLLDRPRLLERGDCEASGLRLDGAGRVARILADFATKAEKLTRRSRRSTARAAR